MLETQIFLLPIKEKNQQDSKPRIENKMKELYITNNKYDIKLIIN